jgi:hypothetical protein
MQGGKESKSATGQGGFSTDFIPAAGAPEVRRQHTYLTTVHTHFCEGAKNYRVLFGNPLRRETLLCIPGVARKVYQFAPSARFALDLWACNRYGTIEWRCYVCEAIAPEMPADTVPFVTPGARVLLHTRGAAQSRLFLSWLADFESRGLDPLRCPAETFEAVHFRLQGSRADKTSIRTLSGIP